MACAKPSIVSALILLLVVVLVMAAEPGTALKLEPTGTSSHIPPLLDCAPADDPASASPSNNNHSAFRANVLSLLVALPENAAAAPTGFAAAESAGTTAGGGGGDRAFARASCFGGSSPGDGDCLKCLSAAARDVARGCGGHGSRRGAVWRGRCFLSYADTDATTAREDAFRGWLYDDDDDTNTTPTAAELVGQCVGNNRDVMECSRCLNDSVQAVPALREGGQLSLFHRDAVVVVVGYSCYLRVPLFPPTTRWNAYALGVLDVLVILLIEICGLLFCIYHAQQFQFNPA